MTEPTKKIIASAMVGPNKNILVVLKWSKTQGFYAVVDGKTKFPKKEDGAADEKSARAWLNMWLRKHSFIV